MKGLQKTNHVSISRFIQESLAYSFVPNTIPTNQIILFLNDAAGVDLIVF